MKPEEVEPHATGHQVPSRSDPYRSKALTRMALLIIRRVRSCAFTKHKSDFDEIRVVSDKTISIEYNDDGSVKSETIVRRHAVSIKVASIIVAGGAIVYYLL